MGTVYIALLHKSRPRTGTPGLVCDPAGRKGENNRKQYDSGETIPYYSRKVKPHNSQNPLKRGFQHSSQQEVLVYLFLSLPTKGADVKRQNSKGPLKRGPVLNHQERRRCIMGNTPRTYTKNDRRSSLLSAPFCVKCCLNQIDEIHGGQYGS